MPLVHIHLIRSVRSPAEVRKLADLIQEVMREKFNAPERDRYQIITQHEPGELICEDTKLVDLPRSDNLIFIQIFQQGRSAEVKQATYERLMERLGRETGLGAGDLIVSCVRNEREDWSFGGGRAQFLTGEL